MIIVADDPENIGDARFLQCSVDPYINWGELFRDPEELGFERSEDTLNEEEWAIGMAPRIEL